MTRAKVWFVGAGPGAADLLTLRAAAAIAAADIVIWAASLVHEDVLAHARQNAEIVDSAQLPLEGVRPLYERAARDGLVVARIHSGDPALWGAVQEQRELCDALGLAHETIPGVSAFSAVAALVDRELTVPEVAQSVILTRLGGGKTPMPAGRRSASWPGTAPRWRSSCPPPGPDSCRRNCSTAATRRRRPSSWRTRPPGRTSSW